MATNRSLFSDAEARLEAIIAIHDTALGPALGGTRVLPYETEIAALADALRLAAAMSYKAAAAELDIGGGKAVIVAEPDGTDEELFRAYGRSVERLGGTYIPTEDMNTFVADMDMVATQTAYVAGTSDGLGDPSPVTAHGIVFGLQACLRDRFGDPSLEDIDVLVQGVGKVGGSLVAKLVARGASVAISDPNSKARQRLFERIGTELAVVEAENALGYPCEVFAPCALGRLGLGGEGSLNPVIEGLACDIVAGAANNVLGDRTEAPAHAEYLAHRDIFYAPDYVINAGGLISTYHEWIGNAKEHAFADAERIEDRLDEVFEPAREYGVTTLDAADRYAERRPARHRGHDPRFG